MEKVAFCRLDINFTYHCKSLLHDRNSLVHLLEMCNARNKRPHKTSKIQMSKIMMIRFNPATMIMHDVRLEKPHIQWKELDTFIKY